MAVDAMQPTVRLFGCPQVVVGGESRSVPVGSQRLLAFAALQRVRLQRAYVAGLLWPFGDDVRATGNLRSALWRLRGAGIDVIAADKRSLMLAPGTAVDVHMLAAWADRLIGGVPEPRDLDISALPADACALFPGWSDDWALLERERVRQRVLHALEALARLLSAKGQHAEAIVVTLRAVAEEPLRESAQRALLTAYLEQGDLEAARAAYKSFADLVRRELGLEPSRRITALVAQTEPAETLRDRDAGGSRPMSVSSSSR